MGALMCKCKSALSAELAYLSRPNKATVKQDLILLQRDGTLDTAYIEDILGICICCQSAQTSVRRQMCK